MRTENNDRVAVLNIHYIDTSLREREMTVLYRSKLMLLTLNPGVSGVGPEN